VRTACRGGVRGPRGLDEKPTDARPSRVPLNGRTATAGEVAAVTVQPQWLSEERVVERRAVSVWSLREERPTASARATATTQRPPPRPPPSLLLPCTPLTHHVLAGAGGSLRPSRHGRRRGSPRLAPLAPSTQPLPPGGRPACWTCRSSAAGCPDGGREEIPPPVCPARVPGEHHGEEEGPRQTAGGGSLDAVAGVGAPYSAWPDAAQTRVERQREKRRRDQGVRQ
jgi:hypothetical protein